LGGALEARGIVASGGQLTAVANGEVEVDAGVLVLRRIHVVFDLKGTAPEQVEAAQRAHEAVKMKCPVYRSLYRAIDITTALNLEPPSRL
jgi:uncharacterized OsmC-like protein